MASAGKVENLSGQVSKLKVNKRDNNEEEEDDEDDDEEGGDEDDDEDDDDDEYNGEDLPEGVLPRIIALKTIQTNAEEIDKEYKAERILLEEKYRLRKVDLHKNRSDIINGVVEAPPIPDAAPLSADVVKGIPDFWLQAMGNNPAIGEWIDEADVPALQCLTDITCSYSEDYKSFTLSFHFKENEFFTNSVLTKTYTVDPDLLDERAPNLTNSEFSEIDWKPSKNLCVTEIKKKQKAKSGKNKGQTRTITKLEPKPSFFHYFSQPKDDDDEEEEDEDDDEDKVPIKLSIGDDYELGFALRVNVIPDAVLWFTGEAREDDGDMDFGDEEDDEDDDEDDEDDEDDDEEETSAKKRKGGKAGAKQAAPGAAPGEQPECKQS